MGRSRERIHGVKRSTQRQMSGENATRLVAHWRGPDVVEAALRPIRTDCGLSARVRLEERSGLYFAKEWLIYQQYKVIKAAI